MSYQEKRALVSLFSTVLITALYSLTMLQRYPDASAYSPDIFHFWGAFFLILIPVSILAKIVIHIIFSIINTLAAHEEEPSVTDERDQLIELKSLRNGLYVFAIGVIAAMGSLVLSLPPATMFILIIGAGLASEVAADVSQFYFYRRGF
jgi:urea transporter